MSTCYRLDLQTLGPQPVMPKNLFDHWGPLWYVQPIKQPINDAMTNLHLGGCTVLNMYEYT